MRTKSETQYPKSENGIFISDFGFLFF